MTNHFKNFIEKKGFWNTRRVVFTDYKMSQEIEFIRNKNEYLVQFNEFVQGKYVKSIFSVEKDDFYKKLSEVVENTIYNQENYKLCRYIKLDTLLAVKFN